MHYSIFLSVLLAAYGAAEDACPPTEVMKLAVLYASPNLHECQSISPDFSIASPTYSQVKAMCASDPCRELIKDVLALKPADCYLSFAKGKVNAYKVASSIDDACMTDMKKDDETWKSMTDMKKNNETYWSQPMTDMKKSNETWKSMADMKKNNETWNPQTMTDMTKNNETYWSQPPLKPIDGKQYRHKQEKQKFVKDINGTHVVETDDAQDADAINSTAIELSNV